MLIALLNTELSTQAWFARHCREPTRESGVQAKRVVISPHTSAGGLCSICTGLEDTFSRAARLGLSTIPSAQTFRIAINDRDILDKQPV